MEPVVSATLNEAVKAVVDELKEGKKLSVEDLLLYLGTIAEGLRAMRAEAAERDRAVREEMARLRAEIGEMGKRIDETNKRIDALAVELSKRIDETNKRIDALVLEFNKQMGEIHKLLSGIHQVLLDISRQQSAK